MTIFAVLAVLGALLVAVAVGMWSAPAGLLVLGVEMLGTAYVGAYLHAKTGSAP